LLFKQRRFLGLVCIVSVMALILTGCGGPSGPKETAGQQIIRYNASAEPQTLDPGMATGIPEMTIINAMFEGLTRYNNKNEPAPGIAESWTISPDGLTYTFKLRDARWSNGDPVTAQGFVDGWLRALDPKLASEYAYQLYYIKGAEEYNTGKGSDKDVAAKALDDKTLQVILKAPSPQFLGLTSFQTLFPVNSKVVSAHPDWIASPENYIGNGPFKMVSWDHNQVIKCVKNPNYWDAANVKLDELHFYLVDNNTTGFNMFKAGQLDIQYNVPIQEIAGLKGNPEFKIMPNMSSYFYRFNVTKKPFNDPRVRRALALAIDRQAIVRDVCKGEQLPAYAYIPFGVPEPGGGDFRKTGGDFFREDLDQARELLAGAGYPDGKGFPAVSIMYNNNDQHKAIAEAIQAMWKKNLNINVTLQNKEWQTYLNDMQNLNYDIVRASWTPDYMDAMTFADMFVTDGGNNLTGWSNKEYDRLIDAAKSTDAGNPKARVEDMHRSESILMEEMPIMPVYFYTQPILIKSSLKNVIIPPFGLEAEFKWAYVE